MVKYDNHVNMIICEVSYSLFKQTRFSTYRHYCDLVHTSLNSPINRKDISFLVVISEIIEKLFAMDIKTSGEYVAKFFLEKKYITFEKSVLLLEGYSPLIKIFGVF